MFSNHVLKLSRLGVLLAALVACSTSEGACGFSVPADWVQADSRWDGSCAAGLADGLGVLKEYSGGKVARFFFGRVHGGNIELGVIDQADGFVAGKFDHGQLVPSDDRQAYIDAFREAEQAAKQAASRFKAAGNEASFRFYENKAKELAGQMD